MILHPEDTELQQLLRARLHMHWKHNDTSEKVRSERIKCVSRYGASSSSRAVELFLSVVVVVTGTAILNKRSLVR